MSFGLLFLGGPGLSRTSELISTLPAQGHAESLSDGEQAQTSEPKKPKLAELFQPKLANYMCKL